MEHLSIEIECVGDTVTALTEAKAICNVLRRDFINMKIGESAITVHSDSNISDLLEIIRLKTR